MARIPKDPEQANSAYRDTEILKKQIHLLKEEMDALLQECENDTEKMCKLQVKAIDRIRQKMLFSKKKIENLYQTLGKVKKGLKSDNYEPVFNYLDDSDDDYSSVGMI